MGWWTGENLVRVECGGISSYSGWDGGSDGEGDEWRCFDFDVDSEYGTEYQSEWRSAESHDGCSVLAGISDGRDPGRRWRRCCRWGGESEDWSI
jgi:hypothetical protein